MDYRDLNLQHLSVAGYFSKSINRESSMTTHHPKTISSLPENTSAPLLETASGHQNAPSPIPFTQHATPAAPTDNVSLSPGQAKFLYWYLGMVPIGKALTTPSTYLSSRSEHKGMPAIQRAAHDFSKAVVSDFTRQISTCSFQLISYFVVGDLIKAFLKQYYARKPASEQNPGQQQLLMQVIPSTVQVFATIFSRAPAGWLSSFFRVDPMSGESLPKPTPWGRRTAKIIDTVLRHPHPLTDKVKAGLLRPGLASVVATGTMIVYFSGLVGILYGISTGLEKAFPNFFKLKQSPQVKLLSKPAPGGMSVMSLPPPMLAMQPSIEPVKTHTFNSRKTYRHHADFGGMAYR
jgi:hypothetical protein